jgi:hypothetical protein
VACGWAGSGVRRAVRTRVSGAARHSRARGFGRVLFVSNRSPGFTWDLRYAGYKSGLHAMSYRLAGQCAARVTVNAVAPALLAAAVVADQRGTSAFCSRWAGSGTSRK